MTKFNIAPYYPCVEASQWYDSQKSTREAWEACPRGDWLLWIASKLGVNKKTLTLAKGRCAETVLHLMLDKRSKEAVRVAIAYGQGKATEDELKTAIAFATAAAGAVDGVNAAFSVHISAVSAAASAAAAYVNTVAIDAAATYAAYAAAYATDVNSYIIAKKQNQRQTADICREVLTEAVFEKIEKGM